MAWETFFLKNHTQHLEEKLFPNNFLKIKNWSYLWINGLKFYTVFILHAKLQTTCSLSWYIKLLQKNKTRGLELVAWFLKKIFLLLNSINWTNMTVWLPLLREILAIRDCNCLLTRLWRHKVTWFCNQALKVKTNI